MNKKYNNPLKGDQLVKSIIKSAQEQLAEHITVIDLRELSGVADFFIVCQSDNIVHNRAVSDGIVESLKTQGTKPWLVEGEDEGRWILIDFSDVIVHVMLPDIREYYKLEELWTEGKIYTVD
ncbi:MAG: ribosome silencing factor [Fibrobacter sp.]|nr:ribosome silencing factor [Fibrobacter sp.]